LFYARHLLIFDRDESEIASVYAASEEDVNTAVVAARRAFKDSTWRDISGTERGDLLYKFAGLIDKHKETLATIETWDNGGHDEQTNIHCNTY
jgi:aldehyde dehydrogenase (NAD+)